MLSALQLLVFRLTHGVAVGDVTASSAILWARASEAAEMVVSFEATGGEKGTARAPSSLERDLTARIALTGLAPATTYRYRVHFEKDGASSEAVEGSFGTAPDSSTVAPVSFIVGGDLGGHGYCRENDGGYLIFSRMRELAPDFFVANGDMIYADSVCPTERPDGGENVPGGFLRIDDPTVDWSDADEVREIYLAHWRYNREDSHFQRFLLQVPMYTQWDDHEVINDFGAAWPSWTADEERDGFETLVREGRRALFDFHPMRVEAEEPFRIYRSFRWGKDLELFLLDARSYRSANDLADATGNRKTLLGEAQLEWLARGLTRSDATWKIVSTDVPLSIPTGAQANLYGRDSFADGTDPDFSSRTGFERELETLLRRLDREDVKNVAFVATDVHFATSLRYEIDADGDGDVLLFHELIGGPLSAFPSPARAPDPTFRPHVLFAEGELFNFAFVRVERGDGGRAILASEIRDEEGQVRFGSALRLIAEP